MDTVAVVGDGAVGKAAAVALSIRYRVVVAGPPGTREGIQQLSVSSDRNYSATIPVMGIDQIRDCPVVFAALKAFDIKEAVPFINSFCTGSVVCVSNGMGLEDEWSQAKPELEYAVLTSGFSSASPRKVNVTPGILYCASNGLAETLFESTFFPVKAVSDIDSIRWAKWYANSIINPLAALAGTPNNQLRDSAAGQMIDELEKELAQIMPSEASTIQGHEMLQWLLSYSPNRCSMLQDIEAGRRTEIDFLTGYCVKMLRDRCPAAVKIVESLKART